MIPDVKKAEKTIKISFSLSVFTAYEFRSFAFLNIYEGK